MNTNMIQDPNPIDDVEFEAFCDWLDGWRNRPLGAGDPHKVRAFIKQSDLKRIWLEGLVVWHSAQLQGAPADLFEYHKSELRNVLTLLETMPDFVPTWSMK